MMQLTPSMIPNAVFIQFLGFARVVRMRSDRYCVNIRVVFGDNEYIGFFQARVVRRMH